MSGLSAPSGGQKKGPRHLIHRLELEIHTSEKILGQALLPRLSRLHHDRLQPLLEQICDGVSPDGRLHRLQSLELDLGSLALEQLEEQFADRLEQALRQALAERLHPTPPEPPASPADSPATRAAIGGDAELIATFAATGNLPWWAPRDQPALIAHALARCLQSPDEPILQSLATCPNALDRLRRAVNPDQRSLLESAIATLSRMVPHHSRRLQAKVSAGVSPSETPSADQPAGSPAESGGSLPGSTPKIASRAVAAADAHPVQASPPPPLALDLPTAQRLAAPPVAPSPLQAPAAVPHLLNPRRQGPGGEHWSIDGAGLVWLWPFLETLCRRRQLLGDDRQFRGEPERQRAIALFGWLVDALQEPQEWRLTLAKVLCGVSPDHPWELEAPLRVEELQELEGLLAAALDHAGGRLGEDSDSLRQNLLQRPGLLTHRPDGWLLQVEQREGDGVLADLPWSVQWLRLVWMAEGLQVSW